MELDVKYGSSDKVVTSTRRVNIADHIGDQTIEELLRGFSTIGKDEPDEDDMLESAPADDDDMLEPTKDDDMLEPVDTAEIRAILDKYV